jgi:hypothetical protein
MATTYQVPSDPTKVMGRRYGAYVIDAVIGFVITLIAFGAMFNYETVDPDVVEQTIGVRNLCTLQDITQAAEDFSVCDYSVLPIGDVVLEDRVVVYVSDDFPFAGENNYILGVGAASSLFVIPLLFWLLNHVVLQGLTGLTAGKALLGLRTVNEQGQAPGLLKALVRSLLLFVDNIGCGVPLVGPITAGTSQGHRRVGDMAAKTFVVGADAMGQPVAVPGMTVTAPGTTPAGGGEWTPPTQPAPPAAGADQAGWAAPSPPAGTPSTDAVTTSWTAPGAGEGAGGTEGTAGAQADAATTAAAAEPQWDPQRNAYIQWDAAQQRWLQFDDASQQWNPIE